MAIDMFKSHLHKIGISMLAVGAVLYSFSIFVPYWNKYDLYIKTERDGASNRNNAEHIMMYSGLWKVCVQYDDTEACDMTNPIDKPSA